MANTGNVFPTVGASVDRAAATAWTNPGDVVSDNTTDATAAVPTDYLVTSGYDFSSIPAGAIIKGVTVRVEASETGSGTSNYVPQLHSNTTPTLIGSAKGAVTVSGTTKVISTNGGAADLWGAALTAAIVKDAGFGVSIWSTDTVNTLAIDFVTIAIEYVVPVAVGQPAETDSAQTLTRQHQYPLGQPSETDSAQAIARTKIHASGQATEAESALAVAAQRVHPIGLSSEADSALPATTRKVKALGLPSEAESALSIVRRVVGVQNESLFFESHHITRRLQGSDSVLGDQFGWAIAVAEDGTTVVSSNGFSAGNQKGKAYVFNTSGTQVATLLASDGVNGDNFGRSVAISRDGSVIVVGAHLQDASDFGKVYVYHGSNWGTETILVPGDLVNNGEFGYRVAISHDGSTIVVGRRGRVSTGPGAVYVYTGSSWGTETKLTSSDGATGDQFGADLAIAADASIIAVGASQADPNGSASGAVYVYTDAGWTTETKITPNDGGGASQWFGNGLSISADGSVLAIGANRVPGGGTNRGAVYMRYGASWATELKFTASDVHDSAFFGENLVLADDGLSLVVSAPTWDGNATNNGREGRLYRYSGANWGIEQILRSPRPASNGRFGGDLYALALRGGSTHHLVVGNYNDVNLPDVFVYDYNALGTVSTLVPVGIASETDSAQDITEPTGTPVGQASETDSAQILTAAHRTTVTLASEADSAPSVATRKLVSVASASELNTAQSLTATHRIAIGLALETDTALGLVGAQQIAVDQASESDLAQALTAAHRQSVGVVTEADTSQTVTSRKLASVGLATETEASQALTAVKRVSVAQAVETETAPAVHWRITRLLELASDTETAQTILAAHRTTLGLATETDSAQAATCRKLATTGLASEADTAEGLAAARRYAVAQASESESAQALVVVKRVALGLATESDTAQALGTTTAINVGLVVETDSAQAVTSRKLRAIGLVVETDLAESVAAAHRQALGMAAETDLSQAITAAKQAAVGLASETDLAQTTTTRKVVTLGVATETDAARTILPAKSVAVALAAESASAFTITSRKIQIVALATETDAAQPMGQVTTVATGQAQETDSAFTCTVRKRVGVGLVSEAETALPCSVRKLRAIAVATESDSAPGVLVVRMVAVGQVLDTETARALTAAHQHAVALAVETDAANVITIVGGAPVIAIARFGQATLTAPGQFDASLLMPAQSDATLVAAS